VRVAFVLRSAEVQPLFRRFVQDTKDGSREKTVLTHVCQ